MTNPLPSDRERRVRPSYEVDSGDVCHPIAMHEVKYNVMRLGSRVATARMEFLGADGTLLASGAAAYIVS